MKQVSPTPLRPLNKESLNVSLINTGTVYYKFADNPEVSSTRVTLEDDDQTMNVFYGKNFDSATGQVVEGEFKDVLIKK